METHNLGVGTLVKGGGLHLGPEGLVIQDPGSVLCRQMALDNDSKNGSLVLAGFLEAKAGFLKSENDAQRQGPFQSLFPGWRLWLDSGMKLQPVFWKLGIPICFRKA